MAHDSRRAERVAEGIREETAKFLSTEAKDPRIQGLVTVTAVDVTPDLRSARIFVSIMGTDEEKTSTLEGLDSLAGYLRGQLARALRLRFAPELAFRIDPSVERAARIEALLSRIKDGTLPPDEDPVA
ncbi:MAG TPA: 30S ribosome-binding factor RbfA [Gemmatimonadaceae bacterium]|nr:30S ribosome-binding factor RbfA [Gemmatimonadaceae bacterium]